VRIKANGEMLGHGGKRRKKKRKKIIIKNKKKKQTNKNQLGQRDPLRTTNNDRTH